MKWHHFQRHLKIIYFSASVESGIRRIEAELGVTLFVRDRTKVVPTAAALQIAKEGMPLVLKAEALTQSIINQGTDVAYRCAYRFVSILWTSYAWKNIEKLSTDRAFLGVPCCRGRISLLEQQICDGLVDVGLFPTPIYSQDLESYPVLDEQILLAISVENEKAIAIADSLMTGDGIREISPLEHFRLFC